MLNEHERLKLERLGVITYDSAVLLFICVCWIVLCVVCCVCVYRCVSGEVFLDINLDQM